MVYGDGRDRKDQDQHDDDEHQEQTAAALAQGRRGLVRVAQLGLVRVLVPVEQRQIVLLAQPTVQLEPAGDLRARAWGMGRACGDHVRDTRAPRGARGNA